MDNEFIFLGHNTKYWLELQKRVDTLGVDNFIQEIADLRGQLSFIQSRIDQINKMTNFIQNGENILE